MNSACEMFVVLAQAGGGKQPGPMDALMSFAPIILIVIAFFWLMSRSQRKKERRREEMLASIRIKDKVVTIGGIHGRVVTVKEDEFVLCVDDQKDVKITVSRSAVSRKADQPAEPQ